MSKTKYIQDTEVIYLSSVGEPSQVSKKLFLELENKFDVLKGRRMYGVYFKDKNEYWATSTILESDSPATLGLKRGRIPGGKYAYEKLSGEFSQIVMEVGPTFEKLVDENRDKIDKNRPSVEFYERYNKFVLMLPIIS